MARVPFQRNMLNPRRTNSFLDTCAFDPKYAPEDHASNEIKAIGDQGGVVVLLSHSNQKELEHPTTPEHVKREARLMIYTMRTSSWKNYTPIQLTPNILTIEIKSKRLCLDFLMVQKMAAI